MSKYPYIVNIDDMIGKPFVWGGRGPDSYDCGGVVNEVLNRIGIIYPDEVTPSIEASAYDKLKQHKNNYWKRQSIEGLPDAKMGVLMQNGETWHVGIVLDMFGNFIHIREKSHVCINNTTSSPWKHFILGYYIYESVA